MRRAEDTITVRAPKGCADHRMLQAFQDAQSFAREFPDRRHLHVVIYGRAGWSTVVWWTKARRVRAYIQVSE